MSIAARCRTCGRRYAIREDFAGQSVPCKKCGAMFKVPAPAEEEVGFFEREDHRPRSSGGSKGPLISIAVAGGVVLVAAIGFGLFFLIRSLNSTDDDGKISPDKVAVPSFPDLPPPKVHAASGAKIHFVDLGQVADNKDEPGMRMKMRVYLPPGEHQPGSLGCMLVAPAGTPLLYGNDMDNDSYHAETLPYVQAGYAVVFYSIDGPVRNSKTASNAEIAAAYKKFKAAQAGVVNGRNALEFVKAKLPQVDPQRIYSAGHSSAGVLSLLLAAHEPRIAGCIAYAPATDVETRLADAIKDRTYRQLLPGLKEFLHESSPTNHVDKFDCPLFVQHARDDRNEPFRTTEQFVSKLRAAKKNVTFSVSFRGGHYQSMVREGIPRAIAWLKNLPGERGKTFPTRRPPPYTNPRRPPVTSRPSTTVGPTITFTVRAYRGTNGQASAERAMRRYPRVEASTVVYNAAEKTVSVRSRTRSVLTGTLRLLLQSEGFVIGGVRVTY